jgi:hypothetical protein
VARTTGRRNGYWVLAGKLERKMPLEDPDLGGKMVLQDRQCKYTATVRRVRVTTGAVKKALTIKYYECLPVCLLIKTNLMSRSHKWFILESRSVPCVDSQYDSVTV